MPKKTHCGNCEIIIENKNIIGKSRFFCSINCKDNYIINKTKEKYPDNSDYAECKICGFRSSSLVSHIGYHNYKAEEYKKEFKSDLYNKELKEFFSERIKGNNNPGYQHGGKLSPFSEKFINYKPETKTIAIQNSKKTKKENPQNENTKIEYYISKGFSLEEAELELSKRQTTFSLEKCKEIHGKEKGEKIWKERQEKWQKNILSKSDEEIEKINKKKLYKNGMISNIEIDFRNNLLKYIPDINYQLFLRKESKKYFLYDIYYKNKIIEFNGDYWHANPIKYKENDIIDCSKRNTKTAKEIWERDKEKLELAEKNGYELMTIWESEYNKNKEEIIKKCINFLNQ